VKEHDSRGRSVDSDILQGKADVLRAVRAIASQGSGADIANHNSEQEKNKPVQVEVRPVVAIRSDRDRLSSAPQRDTGVRPAQAAAKAEEAKTAEKTTVAARMDADEVRSAPDTAAIAADVSEVEAQGEAVSEATEPFEESTAAVSESGDDIEPQAEENSGMPRFRLAEQILAEQRRTASERRQRSGAGDAGGKTYAARDTVGEVIREVKSNLASTRPVAEAKVKVAAGGAVMNEDGMTPIQRQIVAEIIARDIALYSGGITRRRTWPGNGNN